MQRGNRSWNRFIGVINNSCFVLSVSVRDIITESGPYRHGFCYCDMETIKGSF